MSEMLTMMKGMMKRKQGQSRQNGKNINWRWPQLYFRTTLEIHCESSSGLIQRLKTSLLK